MKHLPVIAAWRNVAHYTAQEQKFSEWYEERFAALKISSERALPKTLSGSVIVVIGESATRNLMKGYTPELPFSNTLWLESLRKSEDFVVFDHAYACYCQTVKVLTRAMTEQSQYKDLPFWESMTILDVAKKAGYETHWYTNQGGIGEHDALVTMMAKRADHLASPRDLEKEAFTGYDEDLMRFLERVDGGKNHFIVLHLMGSHARYSSRYPEEFGAFGEESRETAYANSILYTDALLEKVYQYGREKLNLQAMVYFSDHGENLETGHNPDLYQYETVRIPMWVYVSPEYRSAFPVQTAALRRNQAEFFSNDMLYNTLSGLMGAASNHYDEREDLSSAAYAFSKENVRVFLGERYAKDDPWLK